MLEKAKLNTIRAISIERAATPIGVERLRKECTLAKVLALVVHGDEGRFTTPTFAYNLLLYLSSATVIIIAAASTEHKQQHNDQND
jgi:hypothetical protein